MKSLTFTNMIAKSLIAIFIFALLTSCDKAKPAGFWNSFHKNLISKSISDNGPYGGHTEIYWKSDKQNLFTIQEVTDFAKKNKWQFSDSIFFSGKDLEILTHNGQTFPFTYSDFSDSLMNMAAFHKWITSELKLYRFKTNWIAIEPGNSRQTENNGYVLISSDGAELCVYHLWGE